MTAKARPSPLVFWRRLSGRKGVSPFSRPRVSNDNPFSEALFRTCKYVPGWPTRGFASIVEARAWVEAFVRWYNTEHCHSAIRFVTPDARHPARWSGRTRNWRPVGSVWLNPERLEPASQTHGAAAASSLGERCGGLMANTEEQAA
jgi:putative transposase